MDYKAKFIENTTIEELKKEKNSMYEDQYKYGKIINKLRLWDINYTISKLENKQ
jgi:hypothetical protein